MEVDRLGGGFGGKITNNFLIASACGLAAYVTNRYFYLIIYEVHLIKHF